MFKVLRDKKIKMIGVLIATGMNIVSGSAECLEVANPLICMSNAESKDVNSLTQHHAVQPKKSYVRNYAGIKSAIEKTRIGQLKEAIHDFEILLASDPNNANITAWLGYTYALDGNQAMAIQYMERSLKIRGTDDELIHDLGHSYVASLNPDAAINYYNWLEKLRPTSPDPDYCRGNLYFYKKDYSLAEKFYRSAIRKEPLHVISHYNLGVLLGVTNRFSEAAESFAHASDLIPEEPLFAKTAERQYRALRKEDVAKKYGQRFQDLILKGSK